MIMSSSLLLLSRRSSSQFVVSSTNNISYVLISLFMILIINVNNDVTAVTAWKQCSLDRGGGICPDGNTCCSSTSTTSVSGTGTDVITLSSSCIPNRSKDPEDSGQCCNDTYDDLQDYNTVNNTGYHQAVTITNTTGCSYGYKCDTISFWEEGKNGEETEMTEMREVQQQVCKLIESHPKYLNAPITPRYQLCSVSSLLLNNDNEDDSLLKLHGFPIASIIDDDGAGAGADTGVDAEINVYNATYYSNMGNIIPTSPTSTSRSINSNKFNSITTILIVIHGSGRNADEYLCTIMSLLDRNKDKDKNKKDKDKNNSVLIIAPKFPVEIDLNSNLNLNLNSNSKSKRKRSKSKPIIIPKPKEPSSIDDIENVLYWSDNGPIDVKGSSHTWRYGTEAENNNKTSGISSYDIMDKIIEYVITTKQQQGDEDTNEDHYLFPNLNKISVMGHSAGGQYVQRWSLLSASSIIFGNDNDHDNDDETDHEGGTDNMNEGGSDTDETRSTRTKTTSASRGIEIRSVVANPRSYCYLDNRRMIKSNKVDSSSSYVFDVPSQNDINKCPSYNMWEWGLESGGHISSPYRDRALNNPKTKTTKEELAIRYGTRRQVYYIIGSNDTIDLKNDNCETYNTNFQGYTRNERGHHYWKSITNYFSKQKQHGKLIHQFYEVPLSPHDHTIMFQSEEGREAIFGKEEVEEVIKAPVPSLLPLFPLSVLLLLLLLIIMVHRGRNRNRISVGVVVYDRVANDDGDGDKMDQGDDYEEETEMKKIRIQQPMKK